MKKVLFCMCFLGFNMLFSQEVEHLIHKFEAFKEEQEVLQAQQKKEILEYERVYVEVGLVKPIGNLSTKFEASPCFGFWFRSKIKNDDYIDVGFNVMIPQQASNIDFTYKDSVFSLKSHRFGGNLGFRFAKVFPFSNVSPRNNIEWNTGFGVAALFYDANHKRYEDIRSGKYKSNNNETYTYGLATLFLSQGIKINIKNVGLQFNYQFTPYGLFEKRMEPNFGSQSIMFGIYYRQ